MQLVGEIVDVRPPREYRHPKTGVLHTYRDVFIVDKGDFRVTGSAMCVSIDLASDPEGFSAAARWNRDQKVIMGITGLRFTQGRIALEGVVDTSGPKKA